ncbi:MAG: filamentous hemagglutinin N-terminal domain-containing protein, partial [Proteobacteria bacterium]|nr:filamentous hemagglutinin N-terminal domain-containing protein [Pseudomonadota bacterium]
MMLKLARRAIALLLATVLTVQPAILHAGDIINVQPDTARPRVDQSYNGTTVLNIATPNAAGVSHDVYSRFVANDLILNNSATNVSTQLGGWIEGNPNLRPGQAASLWIGEVVGASQTQLNGILEVAGPRMDVVLANEQGIVCNGCGFINTGRTTLTTGVPRFSASGALEGFDVRQGKVTIGAGGLNPESRVALNDTSRVDILARAAVIYGKMRADGLNVVTGPNAVDYNWTYDPATGAVTGVTPISGSGAPPALAVDVSALGGMYANAIQMVATEAGVGVRMDGQMASSTNIALSAKGQLSLGATSNVKARNKVIIRNDGPLQLEGSITSEQGDLVDLRTSAGAMQVSGQVSGGEIRLESVGPAEISAAMAAQGALGIRSTGDTVTIASAASLKGQSVTVAAAKSVTTHGTLNATTALTVQAADGALSGTGTLSGDTVTLQSSGSVSNSGIVTAKTDLTISANAITNTGAMMAGRDIALYADNIENIGGAIWANRDIALAASVGLASATSVTNRNGRIEAFQGDLTIRAETVTNEGTAPTISQSQITRWLETATAGPLAPAEEIVKLVDPAYLGADGKILPAYADDYTALWTGLLGGGALSADALSIMKSAVLTADGSAVASDFVGMWNNMVARANEDGTASPADAVRDLALSSIFDLAGKVKPQYAAAYAELWDTLASGGTEVSASVKAILKTSSLEEAGTTTDPVTGQTVTLYSNTLVSEATDLWAAMKDASSGTSYNIVKFLYQDRFDDNGKLAELVAGGDVSIEADAIHNLYANISAGGDLALTASTVENKALGASQVLFEVHKRPGCFTCHEGKLSLYDTFGGRIEANGNVAIAGAFTNDTVNSSTLAAGEVVTKLNAYIAEKTAEGDPLMAGVPAISSKNYELIDQRDDSATVPAAGNGTDIRVVVPVNNSAVANASPADPTIAATPSVNALVAAGLTTLAETDPEYAQYANFITSNYMMAEGRLAYRDDLVANGREALAAALGRAETNVANSTALPEGPAKMPAADGSGLITVYPAQSALTLRPDGALVAGTNVALSGTSVSNAGSVRAHNNLTVSADSITGKNATFSAEGGALALSALGNIAIDGGSISGKSVELVTGQDFTGKGLSIRSAGDASLFAMGSASLTGLEKSFSMKRGTGLVTAVDQQLSALDVGGDLSIVTLTDLTLSGVDGKAGGHIALSAGADLNLTAAQSTYEFHASAKKSSTDISRVINHTTSLIAGGDVSATAGSDALLVGTLIDAAGTFDLAAGDSVVMTAAQDLYSYASSSKKGNFLSKKVTSV